MNGLGLNTCIQDAYNLAWKIAYVEKGRVHFWLLIFLPYTAKTKLNCLQDLPIRRC